MKNNTNKKVGNYDWFKNGSNNNKTKTPKEKLKEVFKILKIFLYISLATLSLTGCVQTFVIGTSSYSGQGMELYESKSKISPHVISYDIEKGELSLNSKANYYLSDENELKEVHQQIENGGGDISTWKTENNAVRIHVNGKLLGGKNIAHFNGRPLVVSKSETNSYLPTTYTSTQIPVWKYDTKTKNYIKQNPISLKESTNKDLNKVESDFQTATFDTLFQALFMDPKNPSKFNSVYKKLEKALTKTKVISTDPEYSTIQKYYIQLTNIVGTTGVAPVDKSGASTEFAKATEFQAITSSDVLGFNLKTKNSLRAIYDWKTSWKLGPFYGMFVYPLSRLVLSLTGSLPLLSGWESLIAIGISVIIIRTFAYALTFKSTLQQVKQQELSSKRAAIEAKYAQYKGNKQMEQRKRQEMAEMFKKEGISPLGSIGSVFLTMPIFLAMWKIIGGIPHLKSTSWLGIHFSETSWRELFHGEFQYLPLMLFAATIQGISIYIPRLLTKRRDKNRINAHQKDALKKANKTQNIMMAIFVFMALIFSAGLQVYWIFGGIFTIVQNLVNHKIIKYQSRRKKEKRIKAA